MRICYNVLLSIFFFFALRANAQAQPTQATTATVRMDGLVLKQQLIQQSTITNAFTNIGPTVMSGRVVDVAVNPADPTEFYVAYATGGLWHTVNNGQSFIPIMDSLYTTYGIGAIAVNFLAKPYKIWVGTGEVNSSRSSYAGVGMYCSSNNGKIWEYKGLPESHHIGKIVLHPTQPNTAWVAVLGHLYSANVERGIYKTTDAGTTWVKVLYKDENTGAIDIDLNPNNPNEVYASMWYRSRTASKFDGYGATSGLYKSNNGGDTWQLISDSTSGFMRGTKIGRIGVAVSASNPNVVYAVVDNNEAKASTSKKIKKDSSYTLATLKNLTQTSFAALSTKWLDTFFTDNYFPKGTTATQVKADVQSGKLKPSVISDYLDSDDGFQNTGIYGCQVYRSDNAGKTWKLANDTLLSIYNTYGYYFGKIYVSPTNPNKVYILGFKAQVSTNGGKKFTTIDKPNVHPDHHALWINPKRDSHIINGNDGGLCISYDDGAHWFLANTPPVGQLYALTTDNATPYNVYAGLQDNGVWYGSSKTKPDNVGWLASGHNSYTSINGGDGMQIQVDKRDNNTVYSGYQFGSYNRQLLNSPNEPDVNVRPQHKLGEAPLRFNWQSPILLSYYNQDVFYIAANRLYRSFNKGNNLQAISPDLTKGKVTGNVPYGTITTLSESPLQYGLIYTGSDDGLVQVSKDAGNTWQVVSNSLPQGLWVSRVVASKHVAGRVYAALNGYRYDNFMAYLYVSIDYGNTWKAIESNLPPEPVNVVVEDTNKENTLYVGTDGGLYVSNNYGTNYQVWTAGLPYSIAISDITIQEREQEILLGTHGRSIYKASLLPKKDQIKTGVTLKKEMREQD